MPAKCAVCDNVNKLFSSEEASRLKRNAFDLGRRRTQAHDIDTAIGPPVFFPGWYYGKEAPIAWQKMSGETLPGRGCIACTFRH